MKWAEIVETAPAPTLGKITVYPTNMGQRYTGRIVSRRKSESLKPPRNLSVNNNLHYRPLQDTTRRYRVSEPGEEEFNGKWNIVRLLCRLAAAELTAESRTSAQLAAIGSVDQIPQAQSTTTSTAVHSHQTQTDAAKTATFAISSNNTGTEKGPLYSVDDCIQMRQLSEMSAAFAVKVRRKFAQHRRLIRQLQMNQQLLRTEILATLQSINQPAVIDTSQLPSQAVHDETAVGELAREPEPQQASPIKQSTDNVTILVDDTRVIVDQLLALANSEGEVMAVDQREDSRQSSTAVQTEDNSSVKLAKTAASTQYAAVSMAEAANETAQQSAIGRTELLTPEFEQELDVISLLSTSTYNHSHRNDQSPPRYHHQSQGTRAVSQTPSVYPVYLFDSDTSMSHSLTDLLLMDQLRSGESQPLPDFATKHSSIRGKYFSDIQ
jgi:hypothetical protein